MIQSFSFLSSQLFLAHDTTRLVRDGKQFR